MMNGDTFIVAEEIRLLKIAEDERVIAVPAEYRVIEVASDAPGQ